MRHIRPSDNLLLQQLFWARYYLKPFMLNEKAMFWRNHPELYQRLDRTYEWIIKNAREELVINGKL